MLIAGMVGHDVQSAYCLLVDLAHYLECPNTLPSFVSLVIVRNKVFYA